VIELELGPTLRAARRHKGAFALVVMQLGASFTILASLVVVGAWIRQFSRMSTGFDETDLIGVEIHGAGSMALPASSEIAAASRLWPPVRAEDGALTLHRVGDRAVRGWSVYADRSVVGVLGLRLIEGALPVDVGPGAVILTQSLRAKLFPGGAPALGATITSDDAPPGRVVAVVGDVMLRDPYFSDLHTIAIRLSRPPTPGVASYLVRAHAGRRAAAAAALATALGPGGPDRVVAITPYAMVGSRFRSAADGLQKLFAIVGLTVAAIALIGALAGSSFIVAARRRDVGVRRALGARRRDILRYFLVEASLMAALGVGLGVTVTGGLLWAMHGLFYELPIKTEHFVVVAVVLWANAIGAAWLPARRAAQIPPSMASQGG
jgi:putative ABC transport system permease protein